MSLVTHVAVFFALNPDEELTGADIGAKWGVVPGNVGKTLRYAEEKGWLVSVLKPNPARAVNPFLTKPIKFYRAGPRLLKEIGR